MRSWMIGIILGILPAAVLASLPSWNFIFVLCTASFFIGFRNRGKLGMGACGVCLGFAFAIFYGHGLLNSRVSPDCEGVKLVVTGAVASLPTLSVTRFDQPSQRFTLKVSSIAPQVCAGPKQILLSYYGPKEILPGQSWRFDIKLKKPWGLANVGGFNVQAWYAQERIDAIGTVVANTALLQSELSGLRYQHHVVRSVISKRMSSSNLSSDSIAVLKAITVADKSGVDDPLWKLFQGFGINHLLVISGLHIGLVAALGFGLGNPISKLLSLIGYQKYVLFLPQCTAATLAAVYAALAGFSVPTNRALVMLCAFLIASVFYRRSSSWNNLLIAAFIVLVFNPLQILGSGFWLSFAAVAWLLWMNMWRPPGGILSGLLYVHIGMSFLMIPLGGFWFGGASAVSALANLFLIPLVGFYIVPLSLAAASAQWVSQDIANVLLHWAALPVDFLLPMARELMESEPAILYYQFSPDLLSVLLAVFGLCLMLARAIPGSSTMGVVLCVPLLLPREIQPFENGLLAKLTVLDVGQGTAIVFRTGTRTLVYDTGGGNPQGRNLAQSVVIPYLRQENIGELDTLVVSHGDTDHSAGAGDLLSAFPVHQYFSGAAAESRLGSPVQCVAGKAWQWSPSIQFQFLSPAAESDLSSNNGSCVLQITLGETRILLTGDIDKHREKALVNHWREQLASDWLLAGHHGSNSSSSRLWLKYVQAQSVVFSSGYRNAFGHPHRHVLQRVKNGNTALYSTAADGAIEFLLSEHGISAVNRYRHDHPRYWY